MSNDKITTPRGCVFITKSGKAKLQWNSGFGNKWNGNYSRAQTFVDNEVLRCCTPKIPMQTSMLIKSGILGTKAGSGEVEWIAPYASKQYYSTADIRPYDIQRGGHWFERMKGEEVARIIAQAKKIAGGGK